MKTKNLFLLAALIAVLNSLSVGQALAQTFTSLGNFNRSYDNFNFSNDSPFFLGNTLYASLHQLVLSGNTFYCVSPGSTDYLYSGALYSVSTDGTVPLGPLAIQGNTLYGTTSQGGSLSQGSSLGGGTLFSLSFAPQLTIARSGTTVILSWPTNVAGFDYTGYTLQSTTNPVSPAISSTNSPAPVVIAGRNTVTNSITGAQQFYRLSQ